MSELNGTLTSSVNLIGSFGGASTGTSDYNELSNKPSINGVELSGNKTGAQLNLVSDSDLATVATTGNYNDLLHKPVIPAAQVNSDWNSTSGVSAILNKPTIPAAQVNSDWNSDSGVSEILNKPTLSAVATSGDYDDLTNTPTIPVNSDFALSGLSDTDITTPTSAGQVLAYDSNGKVVNSGEGGTATAQTNVSIGSKNLCYKQGYFAYICLVLSITGNISAGDNLVKLPFSINTNQYLYARKEDGTMIVLTGNGEYLKTEFAITSGTILRIGTTTLAI